ncbi:hypothetical protein ACFL59_09300 [Planctomycetota bacterium]
MRADRNDPVDRMLIEALAETPVPSDLVERTLERVHGAATSNRRNAGPFRERERGSTAPVAGRGLFAPAAGRLRHRRVEASMPPLWRQLLPVAAAFLVLCGAAGLVVPLEAEAWPLPELSELSVPELARVDAEGWLFAEAIGVGDLQGSIAPLLESAFPDQASLGWITALALLGLVLLGMGILAGREP